MILPSIKAKYDNYTHFITILDVNRDMLHVCTQYFTRIYKGMGVTIFIALC